MFKLNAKFHADSLLYSVSHFECVGHTVHMLTHWRLPPPLTSAVKSSFTHAHSSHCPWLPVHINVMQTVLIILTMVQHFPDRPCTHKWLTTNITFLDILPVFKMYIQTNMKINFFPFYANNSTFPHCFYLDFFSLN